jgi:peptide/nickel transport system permease protein
VVSVVAVFALLLGVTSAYLGGLFDLTIQRIVDAFIAFPSVLFSLTFLTIFRGGIPLGPIEIPPVKWSTPLMIVIALIIVQTPLSSRIIRGGTFGIINTPYVEAAKIIGASTPRIILRHLAPNVFPVVIVIASVQLGSIILIESALSFLGLGLPPPHPSWGGMLQGNGRQYMEIAPGLAIWPGVAISLAVLAFNLFGDALRDILDPRLRGAAGRMNFTGR